jgi:tetratricopeptide (TPR) repeat protein
MTDKALKLLTDNDTFVAIEFINQQGDADAVAKAYSEFAGQLYWKEKNLQAAINIAYAGIQYALTTAASSNDAELTGRLNKAARGMAYNLSSFTWPGWDEAGIGIDKGQIAVGLDAAKVALRLSQELKQDDLLISRAYWMLGAQYIAVKNADEAKKCFEKTAELADSAKEKTEALYARACSMMVDVINGDTEAKKQLDILKNQLEEDEENGTFFIDQIDTAIKVFIKIS